MGEWAQVKAVVTVICNNKCMASFCSFNHGDPSTYHHLHYTIADTLAAVQFVDKWGSVFCEQLICSH